MAPPDVGSLAPSRDIQCRSSEQPTLSTRFRVSRQALAVRLSEGCASLLHWLAGHDRGLLGPPFVAYHEFTGDEVEVEVGLSVLHAASAVGALRRGAIPSGRYVTTVRQIGEGSLREAVGYIEFWLGSHHEHAFGPLYMHLVASSIEARPGVIMLQRKVSAGRSGCDYGGAEPHGAPLLEHALAALEAMSLRSPIAHASMSLLPSCRPS